MKVIKPLTLGFLSRPFEVDRQARLGVSVMAFVPLSGPPRLFAEQDLWRLAPSVLGGAPVLDEGIPKSRAELLVAGKAFPPGGSATTCPVDVRLGARAFKPLGVLAGLLLALIITLVLASFLGLGAT